MENKEELIKKFWENCRPFFAHLDESRNEMIVEGGYLYNDLLPILSNINLIDTVVLDYGIGKGHLGKLLYDIYHIKKYVGMDIAERSLEAAKDTLESYPNAKLLLVDYNFSKLQEQFNIFAFMSFACIQHFPDLEYTEMIFDKLNISNIKHLILQYRCCEGDEYLFPIPDSYSSEKIARSCYLNSSWIKKILSNYSCTYLSPISKKSRYQYVEFTIQ